MATACLDTTASAREKVSEIESLANKAGLSHDVYVFLIQPVPEKMRLEMLNYLVIEILNDGEILVN